MLEEIYYKKKLGTPYITILLILTCTIVSIPTYFNNDLYEVFASHGKVIYWWQYFTGNFEHNITPKYFFWAHYLGNMFVIGLNGYLIERVVGSSKMLILTLVALAVACIDFRIFFSDPNCTGAGASGIAWAYLPISFYILMLCISKEKRKILKSPLMYVLVVGFIFAWGFVTIMSSWEETNQAHVIATVVGLVMLIIWRNGIKKRLNELFENESMKLEVHKSDKLLVGIVGLVPIGMSLILGAYLLNFIDPFAHPVYISPCENYEILKANNGVIEVRFDSELEDGYSIWKNIEGEQGIECEVEYSEDRKSIYLCILNYEVFKEQKGSILMEEIKLKSGQRVKPINLIIE